MKNDETSCRKPARHRATDIGCACWRPIERPMTAVGQENPKQPFTSSGKPESVAEADGSMPLAAERCRPKER